MSTTSSVRCSRAAPELLRTYRDENDYPGQLFSSKWTTDLDLSYTFWRNITAAIGGKNIFNTYPDRIAN